MVDKVPVKNENSIQPNAEAQKLIEECKKQLENGFLKIDWIYPEKERELTKSNSDKAKIIVHKDQNGATILSSTGSITVVGKEEVNIKSDNEKKTYNKRKAEFEYTKKEIQDALDNGGKIDIKEANKIKELTKIFEGMDILISDDKSNVMLADIYGQQVKISKNKNQLKSL